MFENVKVPKQIDSPINEAILEIRYEGPYPGEALYGILFDVFQDKFGKQPDELPIMQIPKQIRDMDTSFHYQPYYRAANDRFALSIGPRLLVFSALRPYPGWSEWLSFVKPIISTIQERNILNRVNRIGLRYFDVFEYNIFDKINAGININGHTIFSSPSYFSTEFDENNIHVVLNIGNRFSVNDAPKFKSLIDIDCIHDFNCSSDIFFDSYGAKIEKAHLVNKQVFFGLLRPEFLETLNPEY
jgi:uncharacterized protein (TIGR04255 family)